MNPQELKEKQIAYYRARAPEYDEWFLRQGRYDRGEDWNRRWFAEVGVVQTALDEFAPHGRILEIAAGTGLWTARLLPYADHLTALDVSPEALAINRDRLGADARAEFRQADVFTWEPDQQYDLVFFSFWLSHVPANQFAPFWERVGRALRPEGRVIFVDSLRAEASTAVDHANPGDVGGTSLRRLNDGREFRIVKIFYEPVTLQSSLQKIGWRASIQTTENFFLYGSARRV